jgi:hypothetical protein
MSSKTLPLTNDKKQKKKFIFMNIVFGGGIILALVVFLAILFE